MGKTRADVIKAYLEHASSLPGIYKMLDIDQRIIYVGKAKNLKKRLANYLSSDLENKTLRMLESLHDIECIVTSSEVEALILEAQLIKKFQPKFNILLKDDKSFPYIKLRLDHDYPQLMKYRGKNLEGGRFFGPFAGTEQVDSTLIELQKIFKLRSCGDHYFTNRKRPCLQYQIRRCTAPCVGKISKENYDELVGQVADFLSGKTQELQSNLSQKMQQLSSDLRFEEAAELRDRIKALSYIQLKSGLSFTGIRDVDCIAIAGQGDQYCIQVFFYRSAQSCGNIAYFPSHTENIDQEGVLSHFIGQFYQNKKAPEEVIVNHQINDHEVLSQAIERFNNSKVTITFAKQGNKAALTEHAYNNAVLALERYLKNSIKNLAILQEVKSLFNLNEIPERIEIYDNSHIMGAFAVGAMVVATQDGFDKKEYRVYNINIINDAKNTIGDDYAMLRQVLTRRFTRLQREQNKTPSLMIIDGGKGHLSVVCEVMKKFNLTIPFVCMSKGPDRNAGKEQFHTMDRAVFTLDKNENIMRYLQILRDEAHNFAIKNHRKKRSKAISVSSLDEIKSIGKIRKTALLNYFGSYKAICEASITELSKVSTISKSCAKNIFDSLHSK
jgi:excinuclease ABC subunit C